MHIVPELTSSQQLQVLPLFALAPSSVADLYPKETRGAVTALLGNAYNLELSVNPIAERTSMLRMAGAEFSRHWRSGTSCYGTERCSAESELRACFVAQEGFEVEEAEEGACSGVGRGLILGRK